MGKNYRKRAIADVIAELERQDEKWGYPQNNHPFEWTSILGEEFGEMCKDINEACFNAGSNRGDFEKAITEAVQVAAVSVSIVDHLRRLQDEKRGNNDGK